MTFSSPETISPSAQFPGLSLFFLFFFPYSCTCGILELTGGWLGAAAASLHHSHSNTASVQNLPPSWGSARSLTQWARPGMEPASSQRLLLGLWLANPQLEFLILTTLQWAITSAWLSQLKFQHLISCYNGEKPPKPWLPSRAQVPCPVYWNWKMNRRFCWYLIRWGKQFGPCFFLSLGFS